jgi:alkyl sulfatase BDS1-like metallo-beta-lactamase superfamily hydrolase
MSDLLELAEKAWNGELDTVFEHHPVHTFYKGSCELAPDVLALKGIAGHYVVDTGDGLVMLDAGSMLDVQSTFDEVRRWRPETPVVAAIFSHHHVDHIFATQRFEEEAVAKGWPPPRVYAHELMPDHFARYERTLGWNTAINRRQFAIDAPQFRWPERYRYPDVLYRDRLTFRRGALTFHIHHGRGETDDHTWTWIPEREILAPGDLFIYAVPNAGNPQKVQRYVSDWADALERMAGLGARILLPGHGLPILGAERIHVALTDTAACLRTIEDQTLALMNEGVSLDQVLYGVKLPVELMERPYLRPVYDDPRFLIRMVWRRYGGWWDGEFDNLLPAPKSEQAAEWIDLAGGLEPVLERARALSAQGRHDLACHLVEAASHAAPDDAAVHEVRSAVYRANSQVQTSSMARNILNHAALASGQGRRDLASAPEVRSRTAHGT